MNAVRFDGGDLPSSARIKRRSQIALTDGVRDSVGSSVTEAQHVQRSIVLGDRRETGDVSWSLVGIEDVKKSAVHHSFEGAAQARELERVGQSELRVDSTLLGLFSGDCQCRLGNVDAQNRESERGYVKSVLAGAAASIEH